MNDQVPISGWQVLIIVLPSVLAFFTAALAAILGFLGRHDTKQAIDEGRDRAEQNKVVIKQQGDLKNAVNGGLKEAKEGWAAAKEEASTGRREIAALKAEIMQLKGGDNRGNR